MARLSIRSAGVLPMSVQADAGLSVSPSGTPTRAAAATISPYPAERAPAMSRPASVRTSDIGTPQVSAAALRSISRAAAPARR